MPANKLLNQLGLNVRNRKSGIAQYFSDLLKSNRRIETKDARKDQNGNLIYSLNMIIEDDDYTLQFPAVATISQTTPGVSNKINLKLELPSKNYGDDKSLDSVDTSEYQGVENSKSMIQRACWSCFDKVGYDVEKFAQWFGSSSDSFNFDSGNTNIDKYIHNMSFIYVDDSGEESEIEFRMAAIPEQDSKDTVSISFEYPNPRTLDNTDLLDANNRYTGVPNKQNKIIQKVQDFLKSTYGVDSIEQMPNSVVASLDIDDTTGFGLKEVDSQVRKVDPLKNLKLSFEKVTSASGYELRLNSVFASYDPTSALSDLNLIVKDDSFTESIPVDTVATYDVTVNDDSLDVEMSDITDEELEENYQLSRIVGYNAILDSAYLLFLDNQLMGYSAAGPMMNEIQNHVCNYGWRVQEIIDSVSKMMLAEQLGLEHPVRRIRRFDDSVLQPDSIPVFWKDYCIKMTGDIQHLVDALRLYSCNFSEDIQHTMQNWIRSWCHEIDYVLFRGEMDNPLQV